MPLTIPCVLWGIPASSLVIGGGLNGTIRGVFNGNARMLNFPSAGSLTATTSYFVSGDAQVDDLCRMLADTLNTNPDGLVFTVTQNGAGGITIHATGPYSILGADVLTTVDLTTWGLAQVNQGADGGNNIVAPNAHRGAWYPGQPESVPDTLDTFPNVGFTARAIDGTPFTVAIATSRRERDLHWVALDGALVRQILAAANAQNLALETGWLASISLGFPLRFYVDATVRTATSYSIYELREYSSSDGQPWKRMDENVLFWNIELLLSLVRAAS